MKFYEFVGVIPGNLAENEVEPIIKEVAQLFTDAGADVKRTELIGRRKTAYAINNMRHAYYFLIDTELEGSTLTALEKKLKLHKQLTRFLLIKTDAKSPEDIENERKRFTSAMQPTKDQDQDTSQRKPRQNEKRSERPKTTTAATTQESPEKKKEEPVDMAALEKKLDEILDEEIK